jgi:thiol-disulfide isomerase/thioredoxin
MTRNTPLLVAAIAVVGLGGSLLARPIQPFAPSIMQTLSETGATVENWPLRDLTALTPDNRAIRIDANYRGRVVFLTLWAQWCDVCKAELPSLDAFARASNGRFDVVAVSIDQDPNAALTYLSQHFPQGPGFDVLLDPDGRAEQLFGTTAVPETFLIDPGGTVVARFTGGRDYSDPVNVRLADLVLRGSL